MTTKRCDVIAGVSLSAVLFCLWGPSVGNVYLDRCPEGETLHLSCVSLEHSRS